MILPTITIHNLDDVKFRLCARTADNGRSMEEDARLILSDAVRRKPISRDLKGVVRGRNGPVDGVDLEFLTRAYAAIARSCNMAVATRNTRDFEDIDIAVVDPWAAG